MNQVVQMRGPRQAPATSRPVPRIGPPQVAGGQIRHYEAAPVSRYRGMIAAAVVAVVFGFGGYQWSSAQTAALLYEQEQAHAAAMAERAEAAEQRATAAEAALMASETVGRVSSAASDGIEEVRSLLQSQPWIVKWGSIIVLGVIAAMGMGAALRSPLGSGIIPIAAIIGMLVMASYLR